MNEMPGPTGRALHPLTWLGLVLALAAVSASAASRRLSHSRFGERRTRFDIVDYENNYNHHDFDYSDEYDRTAIYEDKVQPFKPKPSDFWGAARNFKPNRSVSRAYSYGGPDKYQADAIYDDDDGDDDDYYPVSSDRLSKAASVGTNLTKVPSWFLPLWGTQSCGAYDNYACGIAIRLCKAFFLAPLNSTLNLATDLEKEDVHYPPSVFMFEVPRRVDIARLNKDGYEWKPTLVAKIGTDQGLFWAEKRDPQSSWDVFNRYPLLKVPLINDTSFPPRDCIMITLGAGEQAAQGVMQPVRSWVSVKLKRVSCRKNKRLCTFELLGESPSEYPQVCTKVGDLGAPILCNNQDLSSSRPKTVHFQVVRLPDGGESCSTQVVAHSLNELIGELRGLLATNLRPETGFIQEGRPTPSYVTWPNNFPKSCGLRETSAEYKPPPPPPPTPPPSTTRPNRQVVFSRKPGARRDPSVKG